MKIFRSWFFIGSLIGFGALGSWSIWMGAEVVRECLAFKTYPRPYQAKVIAYNRHRGGKGSSWAPIVEVTLPDQPTFRFDSDHYSAFQLFSIGEPVDLVSRTYQDTRGIPGEQFEIKNAWHLWLGGLATILFIDAAAIFVFVTKIRGLKPASPFRPEAQPRQY